jgi:predicted acetyltransferase
MIQYSKNNYIPDLKTLWKLCFPKDPDRFVDFYYSKIYQDDETLVCLKDNRPVAALQIIPYSIQTANQIRPGGYLSGIMTHPEHRKQGCMSKLLQATFDEMAKKNYDYAFLIPQEKELVDMYAKYGFRLFKPNPHPPENIVLKSPAQWAHIQQLLFNEKGVWLEEEPIYPNEHKGMIKQLNPAAEEITTLYLGMMMD